MTGGGAVLLVEFLACLLLLRCATVGSKYTIIFERLLPDAQYEYEMCRATVRSRCCDALQQYRRHLGCSKDMFCKYQSRFVKFHAVRALMFGSRCRLRETGMVSSCDGKTLQQCYWAAYCSLDSQIAE